MIWNNARSYVSREVWERLHPQPFADIAYGLTAWTDDSPRRSFAEASIGAESGYVERIDGTWTAIPRDGVDLTVSELLADHLNRS